MASNVDAVAVAVAVADNVFICNNNNNNNRSTQIKTYSWDNAQVTLAGNKCDMEDDRVVSAERGKQLAEQLSE